MSGYLTHAGPRLRVSRVAIEDAIIVRSAVCPECSGEWMRELLHQHDNQCELRRAEDLRLAADLDTPLVPRRFTRAATVTELLLARSLGLSTVSDTAEVEVVRLAEHVRRRTMIDGIDLDRLCTAQELATASDEPERRR